MVPIYDLRASFGTACAQRTNGNAVLVAKLMRHSSIATTQRYIRWASDGADIVSGLHDIALIGELDECMDV